MKKPILWSALVLMALTCSCKKSGGDDGINVPQYPGAAIIPQQPRNLDGAELRIARLSTSDAYKSIVDWYEKETKFRGGWRAQMKSGDITIFVTDNIVISAGTDAKIKDPSKPAQAVVIQGGIKSMVTLFEVRPAGAAGAAQKK